MKSATQQWYEDHLLGPMSSQNAAVREQIALAMDSIPADAGAVDAWFARSFRQPPIAHDTELYNALHKATGALKAALGEPKAGAAKAKPAAARSSDPEIT